MTNQRFVQISAVAAILTVALTIMVVAGWNNPPVETEPHRQNKRARIDPSPKFPTSPQHDTASFSRHRTSSGTVADGESAPFSACPSSAAGDIATIAKATIRLPRDEARCRLLRNVAVAWANIDLAGAIVWARQQPDWSDRQQLILAVAREATRLRPTDALELTAELDVGSERQDIVALAVSQWAAQNPGDAALWADALADARLRQRALAAVAAAWAEKFPAAAAQLVASDESGEAQTRSAITVLTRWTQIAPIDAAAWAAGFPTGELRQHAMITVANFWPQSDLAECAQWLNHLTANIDRDAAASAFARRIAFSAPASAAQWATSIAEPKLQQQTLARVAQAWLARDPAPARNWIEQAEIAAPTKARLLALGSEISP